MKLNIEFIKLEKNDDMVKKVFLIAQTIWRQHYSAILSMNQLEYMLKKFCTEQAINEQIECGYEYFCIMCDGVLMGYLAILDMDGSLFLSKLYILQFNRGRGIGKNAIEFVENLAKERKRKGIWLTCNKYNKSAKEFYLHNNFEVYDERNVEIGDGYVMEDFYMQKLVQNK